MVLIGDFEDVAVELVDRYGENVVGNAKQVYLKVKRTIDMRPRRRSIESDIYKEWENKYFLNINEHGGLRGGAARQKSKLSDYPKNRTTKNILQPKIDELVNFANEQGVDLDELFE